MVASMTGFSSKRLTIKRPDAEPLELTLMLKSLNARYFETNCKLPFALTHLETEIIRQLKAKLIRGTVYVTVQLANPTALKSQVSISNDIVERYVIALRDVQKRFELPGTLTISDLIHLPDIFEMSETRVDENTDQAILKALDELINDLIQTRLAEGALLHGDIIKRINVIRHSFKDLEQRAIVVAEKRKELLTASFDQTLASAPSETRDQQLQLMNAQLSRYDINEEIVRFKAHLDTLKSTLESPDREKGKKIDFLIQELFREVNTIASKANDGELSQLAITIKIELEKIREQGQNIL